MVLEMLNILEHFDLAAMGHNSVDYLRTVTEAMKRATSDKDLYAVSYTHLTLPTILRV